MQLVHFYKGHFIFVIYVAEKVRKKSLSLETLLTNMDKGEEEGKEWQC